VAHAPVAYVIVNPAAGKDEPFLKVMNTIFNDAGWDYELKVTRKAGDARRFAAQAAENGADLVATYGGDGTVTEAASGLVGTQVPLGILPGGTSNMFSKALGIPQTFAEACSLLVSQAKACRPVHMGSIWAGPPHKAAAETPDVPVPAFAFLQLVGVGMEARMVEGADREAKDRLGILAYGVSALQALTQPKVSRYRLELDGVVVETKGVTCLVALVGNLGISGLAEALDTANHPDDLAVVVLKKVDREAFIDLLATIGGLQASMGTIKHWHAKRVRVEANPPQVAQADGEVLGDTPVDVEIVPEPVYVIVPGVTPE
jgi:YegS/Rv2252/BmrU family lipid kinase